MRKKGPEVTITEELPDGYDKTLLRLSAKQGDIEMVVDMDRGTSPADILLDLAGAKKFVQECDYLDLPPNEIEKRVKFYEHVARKVYRGVE